MSKLVGDDDVLRLIKSLDSAGLTAWLKTHRTYKPSSTCMLAAIGAQSCDLLASLVSRLGSVSSEVWTAACGSSAAVRLVLFPTMKKAAAQFIRTTLLEAKFDITMELLDAGFAPPLAESFVHDDFVMRQLTVSCYEALCRHKFITPSHFLFRAVANKNMALVEYVLAQGKPVDEQVLSDNALCQLDMLALFIKYGHVSWITFRTILLIICLEPLETAQRFLDALQLLVDAGYDVRKPFPQQKDALYAETPLELCMSYVYGPSQDAVLLCTQFLVKAGADINMYTAASGMRWTLLHTQLRFAKRLIDLGADPHLPTKEGVSPYELALWKGFNADALRDLLPQPKATPPIGEFHWTSIYDDLRPTCFVGKDHVLFNREHFWNFRSNEWSFTELKPCSFIRVYPSPTAPQTIQRSDTSRDVVAIVTPTYAKPFARRGNFHCHFSPNGAMVMLDIWDSGYINVLFDMATGGKIGCQVVTLHSSVALTNGGVLITEAPVTRGNLLSFYNLFTGEQLPSALMVGLQPPESTVVVVVDDLPRIVVHVKTESFTGLELRSLLPVLQPDQAAGRSPSRAGSGAPVVSKSAKSAKPIASSAKHTTPAKAPASGKAKQPPTTASKLVQPLPLDAVDKAVKLPLIARWALDTGCLRVQANRLFITVVTQYATRILRSDLSACLYTLVMSPPLCLSADSRFFISGEYPKMIQRILPDDAYQWTPQHHRYFSREFRGKVRMLMLAQLMDESGQPRHKDCLVPVLPLELWMVIFALASC
eukprot:TRINITY_DN12605_c0_g1_i1.p1 TRINITY_DN12605_c0_g1~~TRINITY_DN12605_c0_g1_i1.p1  ORF type:complete len:765 (-),score=119.88 TRINITY_DN12605_c0_g1_i1:83-2377(-)